MSRTDNPGAPAPSSRRTVESQTLSLAGLPGVGPARRAALEEAGVRGARDLLLWLPRAHLDRTKATPIRDVAEGEFTVRARVSSVRVPRFNRRVPFAECTLDDGTGKIKAMWFGRHDVRKRLVKDVELLLSGKVVYGTGKRPGLRFQNPDFEETAGTPEGISTGGIIPVYPPISGLGQTSLRRVIRHSIDATTSELPEYLPGFDGLRQALQDIHFPASPEALARARERFVYEEFFLYELAMALRRAHATRASDRAAIHVTPEIDARIRKRLPFRLTSAQERAISELRTDLSSGRPMSRLLQGDVGSGKTAVAFWAMLAAVGAGGQAALLAPTETLAEQHHRTLNGWLSGSKTKVALLTGSATAAERRDALAGLASGTIHLAVGTHALLEPEVDFRELRVAVVDEQHRFGVRQRAALAAKGRATHVLVMTATPIPRTLALTVFGDLDVSTLDELPPGRTPVRTTVLDARDLSPAWDAVRREVSEGHQTYAVYPLVDASDKVAARSAIETHEHLSKRVFPDLRVALLHGRMKSDEKTAAMDDFRKGRTHVLVSTVVIEVGVDVPNATVMLIGNAERFGLAQLHQLRGRIGRSSHPSVCFLAAGDTSSAAMRRLRVLEETQDGFRIAEEDLKLRGPGEFLGTRQSGAPEFHLADLVKDVGVLVRARDDAFALVKRDPNLDEHPVLREEVLRRVGERLGLAGLL